MTSNFFLNKVWTFEDKDFSGKKIATQYGMFMAFSSLGATVQLGLVYGILQSHNTSYPIALILAVAAGSIGNFLLNKRWTFKEKIWS
jgi:dolichol-phosphate mannosyltransferase